MPKAWPEFMQLSLARSADVLLDPDSSPRFVFTERSSAASTKMYAPGFRATRVPCHPPTWIFYTFWACALNALNSPERPDVTVLIRELLVTSDDLQPSPHDWHTLLFALPALRKLYVPGIREVTYGLVHVVETLGKRVGRDLPGDLIEEIHLPDWDWGIGPIPVATIQEIMGNERRYVSSKITWH